MRNVVSLVVAAALSAPAPATAQGTVLKLGTLAPHGSTWHEILKEMGQRWSEASGGELKLRIYPGGVQGNEGEMIRKMGIGQLQAAALSNVGMNELAPEPKALSVPLFFADEREAECAFARVRPAIEVALARRGYAVAQWSRLGAVYLYCNAPRRTPAEMGEARFFAQVGDEEAADAWRAAGFRPVQLSATDLYPALQTGMIDCVPSLPVYVLTARLHEEAPHMMDLPWGYMYGVTLVRRDAWERIAPALRERLLALAHEAGARADAEVRRMNDDALAALRRQGLTVTAVEPAPWRAAMAKAHRLLRGGVLPAPFFDEIVRARDACRSPAAAAPR